MTVVSAVKARRIFGELLNRVLIGNEEIIIERAGKRAAKLVKCQTKTTHQSNSNGKLDFRNAAGLGSELWKNIDTAKYVKTEREQWK